MKRNPDIPSILRPALVICASSAAILQTVAVRTSYDPSENYFLRGTLLPILAAVLAVLGAICGTLAAYKTRSDDLSPSPFSQHFEIPFVAVGFILTAILLPLNSPAERKTLALITSVCLLLAALYGILSGIPTIRENHSILLSYLGFAAILACILATAHLYFDVHVEMNAPLKVTTQVGLITAMVCYTGEIRYLLGKPMPRTYLMLASWTVSLGALAAISVPIACFTKVLPRADYAACAFLVLCLALTQLTRIKTLLTSHRDTEQPTPAPPEETDGKDQT